MSLLDFCQWLAATPASIALRESHYLYLAILATHVLTLCVFLGTALIIDLRLLGLMLRSVPVSEFLSRLLPWAVGGFVVMAASGSLMFFATPVDKYANLFFRAKLLLLVFAGITVWLFNRTVRRRIDEWDTDPVPPAAVRTAGGLSLVFWIGILVAGRMIPYQQYWF